MTNIDGLVSAVSAVPGIDPRIAFGAAQTNQTAAEQQTAAMALHAFGSSTKWRSYLESLPHDEQLAHWSSRSPAERQLLTGAGYKAPRPKHGQSLVGRIAGTIGRGIETVGEIPVHAVTETLHLAGAPLRNVQHLYRAAAIAAFDAGADDDMPVLGGLAPLLGLFNPADWAHAWHESTHGESTFIPSALKDAQNRYDPQTFALAKRLASGGKVDDLIARAATDDEKQRIVDLANSKTTREAVQLLEHGKISIGRLTVGEHVYNAHPLLGKVVSGSIDAIADWFGDPLVFGGKLVKGLEIARYAVGAEEAANPSRLAAKFALPKVQRAIDYAGRLVEERGVAGMVRQFPQLAPAAEDMVRYGVVDAHTFANWYTDTDRLAQILEHTASDATKAKPMLLHASRLDEAAYKLKDRIGEVIDWQKVGDKIPVAPVRAAKRTAKYLTSITASSVVDINSEHAVTQIQRFADSFLDRTRADYLVQTFLAASPGKKREVFQNLTETVLQHAGWKPEDVQRYMGSLREAMERRAFTATPGADAVLRDSGTMAAAGFRANHLQDVWSLPSYRVLKRLGTRDNLMDKMFGAINRDGIDYFMQNAWKPSTLLRIGFPIRAGGEELVAAVMREGLRPIVQARLAGSAVGGQRGAETVERVSAELERGGLSRLEARREAIKRVEAAKPQTLEPFYVAPFHPFKATFDGLTNHLPAPVREAIQAPGDFAGAVFGDRARRAYRNVEGRLAGDVYYNRAKELYDHGFMVSAFAHELSAAHAPGAGYSDPMKDLREGNSRRTIQLETGGYRHYGPTEESHDVHWRNSLNEAANDPITKAALDVAPRTVGGIEGEANQLVVPESDWKRLDVQGSRPVGDDEARIVNMSDVLGRGEAAILPGVSGATAARLDQLDEEYIASRLRQVVHEVRDTEAGERILSSAEHELLQSERQEVAKQAAIEMMRSEMSNGAAVFYDVGGEGAADWRRMSEADLHTLDPEEFLTDNLVVLGRDAHGRYVGADLGREAAPRYDDQVAAVADYLEQHEALARRGERFYRDRNGNLVATGAITQREALEDWARVVVDDLHDLTHGVAINDVPLIDMLKAGTVPTAPELAAVDVALKPAKVKGPELMLHTQNPIREIMDKGFARLVGAPMDWMVRQPMFIHTYAKNMELFEKAMAPLGISKADLVDNAVHTSIRQIIPYIHNPEVRSQMAVQARNLSPFWFAQEQFYKRWVRTFKHSPEAFRQAQLTMNGLRHVGFIHTDENGNDFFMYPLVGQVQDLLTKGYERFTGHKLSIPLPVGFSGQVRFATPGTERIGLPSAGPLVGLSMRAVTSRFPELAGLEQAVLGERGAGRAYWEQILPTTMTRLIHAAADHPDASPQMASAMMQAMAYLESTGHAPPDNATPVEIEAYQDRVKNWTRILFFNRLLFGFSTPAAPDLQLDPNHLHREYRELLRQLPIDKATETFLKRHPDATPYTVFQSKSASGAALPATEEAVRFMESNEGFLHSYPLAGGWFIPESKNKKFSTAAYREQLALELRQRRNPEEFYQQVKFTEAADVYFRTKDAFDQQVALIKNPDRKRELKEQYAVAKQAFLNAHPIFANELAGRDGELRRQQTVEQTRAALNDPRLPKTATTAAISETLAAYDQWQTLRGRLKGQSTERAKRQRDAIDQAFLGSGEQYVQAHPEAKAFWQRIVRTSVEAA